MSKGRKPRRLTKSVRPNNRPPGHPETKQLVSSLGSLGDHHQRLIQTGLVMLHSEFVAMPDGKQVIAIHPVEDEVMLIVPGCEGYDPFVHVITEGYLDCFFVAGYTPRYVSNICEPGALMVVRRFKERPSDQFLGEMISTEWEGLVRP